MSLWQVAIACVLAWMSGALFAASFRGGFFRRGHHQQGREENRYPEPPAHLLGSWHWILAPATLMQLGLLLALLVGTAVLIVMSL